MNFLGLNYENKFPSSLKVLVESRYRVFTQYNTVVIDAGFGPSILNACSLLLFFEQVDNRLFGYPFKEFRLARVLDLDFKLHECDIKQLSSLLHLRHLDVRLGRQPIPVSLSICNLWNIGSLILNVGEVHMSKNFWRMKSLRHVKVDRLILNFSDEQEHEACPKLDKVVRFSCPILSNGKDVQRLLEKLPAVRKLSCCMNIYPDYDKESGEALDFYRNIESLKLTQSVQNICFPLNIHFPSRKVTLIHFRLPWTAIKALAKLHFLQVLKLQYNSFPGTRLEMEDMTFQNLKFFELINEELVEWNAIIESFPCPEQLVIQCGNMNEFPPGFGDVNLEEDCC